MCDLPSPIYDDTDRTIHFTPKPRKTPSVYSVSHLMIPLHNSTTYEKVLEPANVASEEYTTSKFQALSTMVSKAFYPGKWKAADTSQVNESDKASSVQTGKRLAQKRNPGSDIDMACPVSSKQERSHQRQLFYSTDASKSGKSKLPLLIKRAANPNTQEDKHGETRKSLKEASSGTSSMGCEPGTQETGAKDFENVGQQKSRASEMLDKFTVPRYSSGTTNRISPNYSEIVPEANPCSAKKVQVIVGQSEESVPENVAVTVAVRVRPMNDREISSGSKSVVSVTGQNVFVNHPQSNQKISFQYDFCFSFPQPGDAVPCTQEEVYRQVAQPLLGRVFQGYNTCLFAYGQTGSGKSYTMMGYDADIGIIPRFCQELFHNINVPHQEEVNYHVEMSYFEIYNEKIHDLLTSPRDSEPKKALKVREHQTYGPYVDGLSTCGLHTATLPGKCCSILMSISVLDSLTREPENPSVAPTVKP